MAYTTLVSTAELAEHLDDPDWVVIDCRFNLQQTETGRAQYLEGHIPGAVYAHLDEDLSGPIIAGQTGRHPLPTVTELAANLSAWGIDGATQVVVYDSMGGLIAGRVWWMLRWLGHDDVAVLDGDWRHWEKEGRPTRAGLESNKSRRFMPEEQADMQVDVEEVLANLDNTQFLLCDARDIGRFRGDSGGLDPVSGHIPGAICAHFAGNLGADGRFLAPQALRERYLELLGHPDSDEMMDDVVFYCGSGVSAAHNILALQHAGLGDARLYIGSWSEWITDPTRPVATGDGE